MVTKNSDFYQKMNEKKGFEDAFPNQNNKKSVELAIFAYQDQIF